jgi:hypothetical protein
MTWRYVQRTGALSHDGVPIAVGYSGHGDGCNNPDLQAVPNVGPIPAGRYTIGPAFHHPLCGPVSMRLTPAPDDEMFGRSGFLIHGDNAALNHTASDGCIVLDHPRRVMIAASDDRDLVVVSEPDAT